mgnify:CR=1 FL=1
MRSRNLPLRSAADALQGKQAGVTITSSSGSPGSLGNVRIRGVGTINNNDPLYVVDGLPQGDIGWLNARDIESIEVLKDASAQAIYGARAAKRCDLSIHKARSFRRELPKQHRV